MSIDPTGDLLEHIALLTAEVADIKRRLRNKVRTGVVKELDAAKGLVRVKLNDDEDGEFVTGWIPWKERAGAIRSWLPPQPGEQVTVISESGDLTDAWCDHGGFSNANPAPHDKGGEAKWQVGNASILITDSMIEIKVGDKRIIVSLDEIVTHGKTRLDNGSQPVHRIGDVDSDGDAAVTGASRVFA